MQSKKTVIRFASVLNLLFLYSIAQLQFCIILKPIKAVK